MKNIHRLFAAACLTFAGIVGCAAQTGPETTDGTLLSEAEGAVVRYTADELAALPPGEKLRIDLTAPDTVYIVEFADPAALAHVVVVDFEDEYVLADRVPASANFEAGTLNQVVLAGDPALAAAHAATSTPGAKGDDGAEKPISGDLCCDSCSLSGGVLVCVGCKPC